MVDRHEGREPATRVMRKTISASGGTTSPRRAPAASRSSEVASSTPSTVESRNVHSLRSTSRSRPSPACASVSVSPCAVGEIVLAAQADDRQAGRGVLDLDAALGLLVLFCCHGWMVTRASPVLAAREPFVLARRGHPPGWPLVCVNEAAVRKARELIDARQYVLDSDWGDAQPGRRAERFLENALLGGVRGLAPRPHRGRERRDEGALRLRLRRLQARPPHGADRVRLPRRRVAPQGGRARRPRPAAAARRCVRLSVRQVARRAGRAACRARAARACRS